MTNDAAVAREQVNVQPVVCRGHSEARRVVPLKIGNEMHVLPRVPLHPASVINRLQAFSFQLSATPEQRECETMEERGKFLLQRSDYDHLQPRIAVITFGNAIGDNARVVLVRAINDRDDCHVPVASRNIRATDIFHRHLEPPLTARGCDGEQQRQCGKALKKMWLHA